MSLINLSTNVQLANFSPCELAFQNDGEPVWISQILEPLRKKRGQPGLLHSSSHRSTKGLCSVHLATLRNTLLSFILPAMSTSRHTSPGLSRQPRCCRFRLQLQAQLRHPLRGPLPLLQPRRRVATSRMPARTSREPGEKGR